LDAKLQFVYAGTRGYLFGGHEFNYKPYKTSGTNDTRICYRKNLFCDHAT